MDNNIKREIILDNYNNAFNKGLNNDESYLKVHANNESCIDELFFEMLIENNIIKDIKFDGEACVITTSSTSILLKEIIGKDVREAIKFIENYENMIDEKPYDTTLLNEAIVFEDVSKQANRKKCALLSYSAIKNELNKHIN